MFEVRYNPFFAFNEILGLISDDQISNGLKQRDATQILEESTTTEEFTEPRPAGEATDATQILEESTTEEELTEPRPAGEATDATPISEEYTETAPTGESRDATQKSTESTQTEEQERPKQTGKVLSEKLKLPLERINKKCHQPRLRFYKKPEEFDIKKLLEDVRRVDDSSMHTYPDSHYSVHDNMAHFMNDFVDLWHAIQSSALEISGLLDHSQELIDGAGKDLDALEQGILERNKEELSKKLATYDTCERNQNDKEKPERYEKQEPDVRRVVHANKAMMTLLKTTRYRGMQMNNQFTRLEDKYTLKAGKGSGYKYGDTSAEGENAAMWFPA